MTVPDFLIIGAMKAGTTALWHYLRGADRVFSPTPKEPEFFSRQWDRGWEWYEELFAEAPDGAVVGESSPSYAELAHFPEAPGRIASRLPDVRLVYLVRDPVERVVSQYVHNLAMGYEREPLEDAIRQHSTYLDINRYGAVIDAYLEHFAREQLLVITCEALRVDREPTVRRVLGFIGADPATSLPDLSREYYGADEKLARERRTAVLSGLSGRWPRAVETTRLLLAPGRLRRRYQALREVSAGARAVIEEAARPEVARLRQHMGDQDFDGWGLA